MCVKTLLTIGVMMEYGHPLTIWVVEHVELPIGKTNTPLRKEFPLAPIKKIVTPRRYAFTPCLPSNTKALWMF